MGQTWDHCRSDPFSLDSFSESESFAKLSVIGFGHWSVAMMGVPVKLTVDKGPGMGSRSDRRGLPFNREKT
jgi:hypothetical protein